MYLTALLHLVSMSYTPTNATYVPAVNLHVLITCDVNGTRSDKIPNTAIE